MTSGKGVVEAKPAPLVLVGGWETLYGYDFYRHKSDPSKVETTRILLHRVMAGIDYPIGNLPIRGSTHIGAERAGIYYRSENFTGEMDLFVDVDLKTTLDFAQQFQLGIVGVPSAPSLVDSGCCDLDLYAGIKASLLPREVEAKTFKIETDGLTLDLKSLSDKYIETMDYQLIQIDAGIRFLYRRWRYFQPYVALGYMFFNASLFLHYHPGAVEEFRKLGISDEKLLKGRLDFNKHAPYGVIGVRSEVLRWLYLQAEGARLQIGGTEIYRAMLTANLVL